MSIKMINKEKDVSEYWKDNGIEKPQAVVVCAACKYKDMILCGARHWDKVMAGQFDLVGGKGLSPSGNWEQGFINQFGEFLTREEALEVAMKTNGVDFKRNGSETELFSEGLY